MKLRLSVAVAVMAIVGLATVFSLFSGSPPLSTSPAQAVDRTIHVGSTYFCPTASDCTQGASNTYSISVGDTVTWVWDEGNHTTTSCSGAFTGCSGGEWNHDIDSGAGNMSFAWTAGAEDNNKAFYFQCAIHTSAMRGVVIVGTPATPSPTPSPSPTVTATATATATPSPTPPSGGIKGDADCNGFVQVPDSIHDQRFVAGLNPGLCVETLGNVDCTDGVTTFDSIDIQLYIGGLPVPLPPGCGAIGAPA